MKKINKWEVVWSNNKPIIVYRSPGVLKLFFVEIKDDFVMTGAIKGSNYTETYKKTRNILCEKFDLDQTACDEIRHLYHEHFGYPYK